MGAGRTLKGDRNLYKKEKRHENLMPEIRVPSMRGGVSARAGLSLGLNAIGKAFKDREDKRKKCCEARKKRASSLNYTKNINAYNNLTKKYGDEYDKTIDDRTLSGSDLAESRTKYIQEKMTPMMEKHIQSFPMNDEDYQNYNIKALENNNTIYQNGIIAGTNRSISNFTEGLDLTNTNNLTGLREGTTTLENAKKDIDTYIDNHKDLFTPEQEANYKKKAYDSLKKAYNTEVKEQYQTLEVNYKNTVEQQAENGTLTENTIQQGENLINYYKQTGDHSKALETQQDLIKRTTVNNANKWEKEQDRYISPEAKIEYYNNKINNTKDPYTKSVLEKHRQKAVKNAQKPEIDNIIASNWYAQLSKPEQIQIQKQYSGGRTQNYIPEENIKSIKNLFNGNAPVNTIKEEMARIANETGLSNNEIMHEISRRGGEKNISLLNAMKNDEIYSAIQSKKLNEKHDNFTKGDKKYRKLYTSDIWKAINNTNPQVSPILGKQAEAIYAQARAKGESEADASQIVREVLGEQYTVMNKEVTISEGEERQVSIPVMMGGGGNIKNIKTKGEIFPIKNLLINKGDEPKIEDLIENLSTKRLSSLIDNSTTKENKISPTVGIKEKEKKIISGLGGMRKDKAIKWLQKNAEVKAYGNTYVLQYYIDGHTYQLSNEHGNIITAEDN